MASLSSDKDKTKRWLNIYGLKWQHKEQSNMFARENEKMWKYVKQTVLPGLNKTNNNSNNNNNNNKNKNNGLFTAFLPS